MRRLLVFVALACALALPAFAHARLTASTPRPGAVLKKMPDRVVLTFTEPMEMKVSRFTVVALDLPASATASQQLAAAQALLSAPPPQARRVDRGVEPAAGRSAEVRIALDPAARPGCYAVVWKALSADGHVVKDVLVFKVAP